MAFLDRVKRRRPGNAVDNRLQPLSVVTCSYVSVTVGGCSYFFFLFEFIQSQK